MEVLTEIYQTAKAKPLSNPERFFKTGPGHYSEGDKFLGISNPDARKIAKTHASIPLSEVEKLFTSPFNEVRLVALFILIEKYPKNKEEIFDFYTAHLSRVNNWNLVDCSASQIMGTHLHGKDHDLLYTLARSPSLWERRIAIVATHYDIKKGVFTTTLSLAKLLLTDSQDLMHKAVGWMLREVGKKDEATLKNFLDHHAHLMPRTALRYALERLSPEDRSHYMQAKQLQV